MIEGNNDQNGTLAAAEQEIAKNGTVRQRRPPAGVVKMNWSPRPGVTSNAD